MTRIARLDDRLIERVVSEFPQGPGWEEFDCREIIRQQGMLEATWLPLRHLEQVGGVYAILLPAGGFARSRKIRLHGPKRKRIPFEFTLKRLTRDGLGIVYIGRTTNLAQRWRGHLSRGERKDGGQVKFGLLDCRLCRNENAALRLLRESGRIAYCRLPGPENCANRDIIELKLCARFTPPFNIKSER